MKKVLLSILTLLTLLVPALAGGSVSKSQLSAFISDCRRYDGVEVVRLGGLTAMALKATIRLAAADDPDARELVKVISNIKKVIVFDYDDCEPVVRNKINRKLDRILSGSDLLLETREDGQAMQIYGVIDERAGTVRDFVMHDASGSSLICFFGSISIDKLSRVLADND